MAAYEFDGEKYKQASSHQKEWGSNLISQLHLTGAETVLDLGCGDGTCAAFYDVVRTKMRDKQYAHYFNNFIWPWFMPSKEQYKALIGGHF